MSDSEADSDGSRARSRSGSPSRRGRRLYVAGGGRSAGFALTSRTWDEVSQQLPLCRATVERLLGADAPRDLKQRWAVEAAACEPHWPDSSKLQTVRGSQAKWDVRLMIEEPLRTPYSSETAPSQLLERLLRYLHSLPPSTLDHVFDRARSTALARWNGAQTAAKFLGTQFFEFDAPFEPRRPGRQSPRRGQVGRRGSLEPMTRIEFDLGAAPGLDEPVAISPERPGANVASVPLFPPSPWPRSESLSEEEDLALFPMSQPRVETERRNLEEEIVIRPGEAPHDSGRWGPEIDGARAPLGDELDAEEMPIPTPSLLPRTGRAAERPKKLASNRSRLRGGSWEEKVRRAYSATRQVPASLFSDLVSTESAPDEPEFPTRPLDFLPLLYSKKSLRQESV